MSCTNTKPLKCRAPLTGGYAYPQDAFHDLDMLLAIAFIFDELSMSEGGIMMGKGQKETVLLYLQLSCYLCRPI